jgi:tetratricopeptide (TPR) repeat protein
MSDIKTRIYPRRLPFRVGAVVVALAVAAAGGWYGWLWFAPPPPPPDVPLSGLDPAVANAVATARHKVLNDGRSAAAWGEFGQVLGANGLDHSAVACFAQAERLDPNEPRWPYYQGLSLTLQNPDAAIPLLRRAVALADKNDRGNDAPRLTLAETLLQTEAYAEAEEHLDRVLSWAPDDPRVHYDLGALAVARHDDAAACPHLTLAAASPYCRRKSYSALAAVRLRQGDATGAADFSRQAAAANADAPWPDRYVGEYAAKEVGRRGRFVQADSLMSAGRPQDALPILLELAQDASDAHAQIAAGTAFYRLGQLEKAEHYCRAAVGLETEQAQANYSLAVILCEEGDRIAKGPGDGAEAAQAKYREAMACADRALELKPDHALAHLYRGLALKGLRRRKEAIESLRQAVLLVPDMSDVHLELGGALAEDGQREEAVAELRRAVKTASPDDSRPRQALERVVGAAPK